MNYKKIIAILLCTALAYKAHTGFSSMYQGVFQTEMQQKEGTPQENQQNQNNNNDGDGDDDNGNPSYYQTYQQSSQTPLSTLYFSIDGNQSTATCNLFFTPQELNLGIQITVILFPPSYNPKTQTYMTNNQSTFNNIHLQNYRMVVCMSCPSSNTKPFISQDFTLAQPTATTTSSSSQPFILPTSITVSVPNQNQNQDQDQYQILLQENLPSAITTTIASFIKNSPLVLEYTLSQNQNNGQISLNSSNKNQILSLSNYSGQKPISINLPQTNSFGFTIDPTLNSSNVISFQGLFTRKQLNGANASLLITPPAIVSSSLSNVTGVHQSYRVFINITTNNGSSSITQELSMPATLANNTAFTPNKYFILSSTNNSIIKSSLINNVYTNQFSLLNFSISQGGSGGSPSRSSMFFK